MKSDKIGLSARAAFWAGDEWVLPSIRRRLAGIDLLSPCFVKSPTEDGPALSSRLAALSRRRSGGAEGEVRAASEGYDHKNFVIALASVES